MHAYQFLHEFVLHLVSMASVVSLVLVCYIQLMIICNGLLLLMLDSGSFVLDIELG